MNPNLGDEGMGGDLKTESLLRQVFGKNLSSEWFCPEGSDSLSGSSNKSIDLYTAPPGFGIGKGERTSGAQAASFRARGVGGWGPQVRRTVGTLLLIPPGIELRSKIKISLFREVLHMGGNTYVPIFSAWQKH